MLTIHKISKAYPVQGKSTKIITALNNVSLHISEGESVALIGESGCGKSTLCRMILALDKPDSGSIQWMGNVLTQKTVKRMDLYRHIQPVFQDNLGCFDPRWKIWDSVTEPMRNHLGLSRSTLDDKAKDLMDMVDLPASILDKYPHELSGGQQKRVCIARAVSINPKLLLLDEAVAGLDATVMLKILRLLLRLHLDIGCAYLFITHDIHAALYIADTVAVMHGGSILETVRDVCAPDNFEHPFSKMLLQNITTLEDKRT